MTGLALFLLASALCGAAPTATTLNLARAFQGVAASILLTSALPVINQAFTGPDRGRAYAVWGTCMGIAIVSGLILGGGIVEAFGWRAAFLINVPICAFLLLRIAKVVEESRDDDAHAPDWAGIGTFTLTLLLLTWSLIDGNARGWGSAAILARLTAAAVLFFAFVVVETRQRRAMIDLTLFRQRRFVGSACAMLGYASAAQVMIFFLPSFLQRAYGLGATWAGLAMLPFALPMFAMPQITARLARRFSARIVLNLGLSVTLAGDLLMSMLAPHQASYVAFALAMLATGAGAGLLNGETTKVIQEAAPRQRSGMASGISATVRFTGLLLTVAGLGAASESVGSATFIARLRSSGLDEKTIGHLVIRAMVDAPSEALGSLPLSLQSDFQADLSLHRGCAQAGRQQRHARDVAVVLAGLVGAAVDDVVDLLGIEAGFALGKRADPRHFEGMGGALLGSIDVAITKAATAVLFEGGMERRTSGRPPGLTAKHTLSNSPTEPGEVRWRHSAGGRRSDAPGRNRRVRREARGGLRCCARRLCRSGDCQGALA